MRPQRLLRILLLVTPEGGHELVHRIEQLCRPDHCRLLTAAAAASEFEECRSEGLGHLTAEVRLASHPARLAHRAVARGRQPRQVQCGAAAQVVRERRAVRERLPRGQLRVRVRRCARREAQPCEQWRSVRNGEGSGKGGQWAAPGGQRSCSMCCPGWSAHAPRSRRARPRIAGRDRRPRPCGAPRGRACPSRRRVRLGC